MRHLVRAFAIAGMVPMLAMPAAVAAQTATSAATPAQQKEASQFVNTLAGKAFAVLRNNQLSKTQARQEFRELLRNNFAVDDIGMRLIRRHRRTLSSEQIAAYQKALPDFVINTYSDRLYDFAAAKVNIVRTAPRGSRGDVDVYTKITNPNGGAPIDAIWTVKAGARPLVSNLTVSGVNVALTQEQDFNAYIERNGFDALITFMQQRAG